MDYKMSKEQKIITKEDLLPLDSYTKVRRQMRKELVEFKKNRRILLGPYATFYFECYETMIAQVQEMLYIEKGGDEQVADELAAYNPLIPNGKELVATLMFEIDEKIYAVPEMDVDRTSDDGKASSVQFIHFKFSDDQVSKFKDQNNSIEVGIDHKEYSHTTKFSEENIKALSADFN
jgi:hypothetical protein